jgi:hypothetical protein
VIDILTMWIMLLLPLAVVVVMVLVDILHVGEQTQRVLTVILYILLAAILINLFILPWIRKGIHWALERQKTKARIRDLKTLIRRFETGQPVSTEELIRLLRATGEKRNDTHQSPCRSGTARPVWRSQRGGGYFSMGKRSVPR